MSIQFTARPTPSRRPLALTVALVAFFTLWHTLGATFGATATTGGTLHGAIFEDLDTDGVFDASDTPWGAKWIHVYDADGNHVTGAESGADGTWQIPSLPAGSYQVRMSSYDWNKIKYDYVPTTVDSLRPVTWVEVTEAGSSRADLGWRLIGWSDSLDAPITEAVAADGLTVTSYTDAVTASEVLGALEQGTLRGAEAQVTEIRFGYHDTSFCWISVSGSPGSYSNYSANCYVTYASWLDYGDKTLFHEYGHAWSRYHDYIVMQEGDLASYLEVRGLTGDDRLETNHAWDRGEIIAEDYRQLFGSPTAAASPQENREIPPAEEVTGLAEWLAGEFMGETATTDANAQPNAAMQASCDGLSCTFDASDSSDSDGTVTAIDFTLGDGNTATGTPVAHTYPSAGDYTVEVTVTDDDGATASTSEIVTVSEQGDATEPPSAPGGLAAADNGDGTVTLTWSDTSDTEDSFRLVREEFHRRNGKLVGTTSATLAADTVTFTDAPGAGDYRYTLTAANAAGDSTAVAVDVTVTDASSSKGGGGAKCHPQRGC